MPSAVRFSKFGSRIVAFQPFKAVIYPIFAAFTTGKTDSLGGLQELLSFSLCGCSISDCAFPANVRTFLCLMLGGTGFPLVCSTRGGCSGRCAATWAQRSP